MFSMLYNSHIIYDHLIIYMHIILCLESNSLQQLASWLSWWFPHSTSVFRFLQWLPSRTFRPVAMKRSRPSAKSSSRARWVEDLPPQMETTIPPVRLQANWCFFCWGLSGLKGWLRDFSQFDATSTINCQHLSFLCWRILPLKRREQRGRASQFCKQPSASIHEA